MRAQIEGLKEQINAWEQRLKLASEQEQAAAKAAQSAKEEIVTLKEQQMSSRAPAREIATVAEIERRMIQWLNIQEQVKKTLQPLPSARSWIKTIPAGKNPLG